MSWSVYICEVYYLINYYYQQRGFPGGSEVRNPFADMDSDPGLVRSSVRGNGNPFQYSCLGNPKDRGIWWAIVHGLTRFGQNLATNPPPLALSTKSLISQETFYLYYKWKHLILYQEQFIDFNKNVNKFHII